MEDHMTLEQKMNQMAEERFVLTSLKDFEKITALQVAYMAGIKDGVELPEVKALVTTLNELKYVQFGIEEKITIGGVDFNTLKKDGEGNYLTRYPAREALAAWNEFVGEGK